VQQVSYDNGCVWHHAALLTAYQLHVSFYWLGLIQPRPTNNPLAELATASTAPAYVHRPASKLHKHVAVAACLVWWPI
jgi:hypothetical protein